MVAAHTPPLIFPGLWTVSAIATKVDTEFEAIAWGSMRWVWSASSYCLVGRAIRFRFRFQTWVCAEWGAAGTVSVMTRHASCINTVGPDVVAVATFPVGRGGRHDS